MPSPLLPGEVGELRRIRRPSDAALCRRLAAGMVSAVLLLWLLWLLGWLS